MAKKLWGGRFKKNIDKDFFEFQKSIQYDHKLAKYDIMHSLIHVIALYWANILSVKEKQFLLSALKEIQETINRGKFKHNMQSEDIHTDIHNKVEAKIGKLALKLHTLRSRNDQIVFDEKSYCYEKGRLLVKFLADLGASLKFLGNKYRKTLIVGYTHTQRAQKIYFAEYIGAFCNMFERDKKRIFDFLTRIEIHIGAGALAGSLIKKECYDKAIKDVAQSNLFSVSKNSIDDVSDRDFIIEFLSDLSILQMHLSRLSEDLIIFSTKEFNFIDLPEEFCTGSSLMPHKKNPDFLELVRGSTGKIYGNLMAILTIMKGMPLTYNRDMQLDKEPLFSSVETIEQELKIISKFIKKVELNLAKINAALKDVGLSAVDEAAELVIKKGISFRDAHDIIGRKIRELEG
ncbi:MAG: argininosuccinate lyase [Candidatus Omnitrophota bacterium]